MLKLIGKVLRELCILLGIYLAIIGLGTTAQYAYEAYLGKNTPVTYSLYSEHDGMIQQPIMFTLNHDLVSDRGDMFGYCLTEKSKDVECFTMGGRYIGVGNVEQYYDGNKTTVYVMTEAPTEYRRVMNNAFLRVWAE